MAKYAQSIAILFNQESLFLKALQVVLGSLLLGLAAQAAIPLPFTPVPLSLQSLAVLVLAMTLGKNKAALAVITYLMQATLGFPVLAGGLVNSLWIIGPRAGYLIGFLAASYLVGFLLEKHAQKGWKWIALSLSIGELTILLLGTYGLSFFVGMENAFYLGFMPFVVNGILKITMATGMSSTIQSRRSI